MSARAEIENSLARYAWAYDMDQLELIGDCFAENAEVVFGTGLQTGRPAIVAELERMREVFRVDGLVPWHVITSVYIREETEREATVTAFYTFFTKPEQSADFPTAKIIGYYDDRYVNDDGVWRVAHRRVLSGGLPVAPLPV